MLSVLLKRFGFYAAVLVGLIGLVWFAHHRVYEAGYRAATAAMDKKVAQANEAARLAEINSREAVKQVEYAYQSQLNELDSKYRDAADRLGAVRLCQPASGSRPVPGNRPATSVPHGSSGGAKLLEAPSPDIGPALVALARDADACAARLTGLQEYVRTRF
jgi:hypothetical protein